MAQVQITAVSTERWQSYSSQRSRRGWSCRGEFERRGNHRRGTIAAGPYRRTVARETIAAGAIAGGAIAEDVIATLDTVESAADVVTLTPARRPEAFQSRNHDRMRVQQLTAFSSWFHIGTLVARIIDMARQRDYGQRRYVIAPPSAAYTCNRSTIGCSDSVGVGDTRVERSDLRDASGTPLDQRCNRSRRPRTPCAREQRHGSPFVEQRKRFVNRMRCIDTAAPAARRFDAFRTGICSGELGARHVGRSFFGLRALDRREYEIHRRVPEAAMNQAPSTSPVLVSSGPRDGRDPMMAACSGHARTDTTPSPTRRQRCTAGSAAATDRRCRRVHGNSDHHDLRGRAKLYLQGRDLVEKLRFTDGNSYFHQAVEKDPDFALAWLAAANSSATATEFFEELKKAVAASSKVSEGEQHVIMGADAGARAEPAAVEEHYTKLVAMYPDDARAHNLLGTYYFGR